MSEVFRTLAKHDENLPSYRCVCGNAVFVQAMNVAVDTSGEPRPESDYGAPETVALLCPIDNLMHVCERATGRWSVFRWDRYATAWFPQEEA